MHPYFILIVTIIAIVLTIVFGWRIKNKRKRIIVIMLILLLLSTISNRSIYWIIYWDGPYHGQVVDADTGNPIEGAAVAGIWTFEYFHIKSSSGFANASETVTDSDGEFWLPVILAFSPWPFTVIDRMDLVVFKPGYDSHPPSKQLVWTADEKKRYGMTNHEYRVRFTVECEMWKKCMVRLNKARTIKERWRASGWSGSRLGEWDIKPSKIKYFIEMRKIEDHYLDKLKRENKIK